MEQYSRRNSILIHGLLEVKRKDIDSLAIETVKEKMDLDISSADTDRTHLIGVPLKNQAKLDLSLFVLFALYNDGRKIYINQKLLKEIKVSITESLTAHRVAKLKQAKGEFRFKNAWSNDGRKIYKDNGDDKTQIYSD